CGDGNAACTGPGPDGSRRHDDFDVHIGQQMIRRILAATVIAAIAGSTPALAQRNSQKQKKSAPPPRSRKHPAAPPITSVGRGGASPIAWVDDATVLESGGVALAVSALRWSGGGMSEVNVPVVDVALGLTRRVQFSASI